LSSALSAAFRPRKHARHAKPSKAAPALLAGGMSIAFVVAEGAVSATAASAGGSQAQFEQLAQCESGGNWAINTGNGYYGGLQFNLATWRGLGLGGYPHQASKSQQIAAGQKLHGQRGWQPWPACTRKLGLRGDGGVATASAPAPVPAAAPARASRTRTTPKATAAPRVVRQGVAAPAYAGHVMTVADRRGFRQPVLTWQRQMRARGWKIGVDGYFGPQSSSIARQFAVSKGLKAAPGTVNAAVWAAAWTAPVT